MYENLSLCFTFLNREQDSLLHVLALLLRYLLYGHAVGLFLKMSSCWHMALSLIKIIPNRDTSNYRNRVRTKVHLCMRSLRTMRPMSLDFWAEVDMVLAVSTDDYFNV